MSREQARSYVVVFSRAGYFIVTGESRLYVFFGYRVQFWRLRTVSYKRVALYYFIFVRYSEHRRVSTQSSLVSRHIGNLKRYTENLDFLYASFDFCNETELLGTAVKHLINRF